MQIVSDGPQIDASRIPDESEDPKHLTGRVHLINVLNIWRLLAKIEFIRYLVNAQNLCRS